jgi:hypothetical protein
MLSERRSVRVGESEARARGSGARSVRRPHVCAVRAPDGYEEGVVDVARPQLHRPDHSRRESEMGGGCARAESVCATGADPGATTPAHSQPASAAGLSLDLPEVVLPSPPLIDHRHVAVATPRGSCDIRNPQPRSFDLASAPRLRALDFEARMTRAREVDRVRPVLVRVSGADLKARPIRWFA